MVYFKGCGTYNIYIYFLLPPTRCRGIKFYRCSCICPSVHTCKSVRTKCSMGNTQPLPVGIILDFICSFSSMSCILCKNFMHDSCQLPVYRVQGHLCRWTHFYYFSEAPSMLSSQRNLTD